MQLGGWGWDISGVEGLASSLLQRGESGEGLRQWVLAGVRLVLLLPPGQGPLAGHSSGLHPRVKPPGEA